MNAPAALYWYHQQPRTADYRNSSANRTGPYITELDMTGQPGVLKIVKYVPEETVAAAVVAEGISEYERGLRDGAALERKALAAALEITNLAIEYKKAAALTESRVNDPGFLENADAADLDEIDLEEILARMKLFNAIHERGQGLLDSIGVSDPATVKESLTAGQPEQATP